ncbi:MAG: hypothetical protein N3B13_01830 [Deltaproteobacteria bacterium]|nr:hypothetical protein [Deltaproteobacteria bacterium]
MLRSLLLIMLLFFLSCGITDLINSDEVDCKSLCLKKSECSEIGDGEENSCNENCQKLLKYGYIEKNAGKKINDCTKENCEKFRSCLNNINCEEPEYHNYINTRCKKFDQCGSAIPETTCLISGTESVGTDIKNSILKCSTDKLFIDISECINNGVCEYIEDYTESCLEYYYLIKTF